MKQLRSLIIPLISPRILKNRDSINSWTKEECTNRCYHGLDQQHNLINLF